MKHSFSRLLLTVALLSLAPLALTACSADEEGDDAQQQPIITEAPPPPAPPEIENVPMMDDPTHQIWRAGYWAFENNHFIWVEGKIILRPSPTAVWVAAHWQQHNFGWSFQQGHWQ